jgi:hypothetical protein
MEILCKCKSFTGKCLNFYTYIYIVALYNLFIHLHKVRESKFLKYTYAVSCKCFGACKCINYMSLMIILSCKFILISCECIQILFYFLQWAILIGPSQKLVIFWYPPNISICLPIWDYGDVIPRNISNAHLASPHCLSTTFITTIIFMSSIQ